MMNAAPSQTSIDHENNSLRKSLSPGVDFWVVPAWMRICSPALSVGWEKSKFATRSAVTEMAPVAASAAPDLTASSCWVTSATSRYLVDQPSRLAISSHNSMANPDFTPSCVTTNGVSSWVATVTDRVSAPASAGNPTIPANSRTTMTRARNRERNVPTSLSEPRVGWTATRISGHVN